jgi:hypothetical protein
MNCVTPCAGLASQLTGLASQLKCTFGTLKEAEVVKAGQTKCAKAPN